MVKCRKCNDLYASASGDYIYCYNCVNHIYTNKNCGLCKNYPVCEPYKSLDRNHLLRGDVNYKVLPSGRVHVFEICGPCYDEKIKSMQSAKLRCDKLEAENKKLRIECDRLHDELKSLYKTKMEKHERIKDVIERPKHVERVPLKSNNNFMYYRK